MEKTRRTNESRKRERLEKIGRIKSKAAFRCLHASRLNEDQSRARSSKQDDWPRVGLGYGRGAHDKNGATRRRRGLFYSRINAACADAPPTDRPGLLCRKTPFTSPHLLLVCHSSSPSPPRPFFVIGRHEFPGLTPGRGVIMRRIDGWHGDGFGIVRGHVDDRSKDFRGFRLVAWRPRTWFARIADDFGFLARGIFHGCEMNSEIRILTHFGGRFVSNEIINFGEGYLGRWFESKFEVN